MSEPLVLLRWHKNISEETRADARRQRGMKRVPNEQWDKVGIELYELPPGLAKKSVEWLISKGWCQAEVDSEGQSIPIDPSIGMAMSIADLRAGKMWYQQRVGAPSAWTVATGKGIKIGVADSGANHEHEWLKPRIVASKNFVANETTVHDNEGHGTACAGIVVALALEVSIVVARVMSQNSAKWSAVGAGWIWLADQGCIVASTSIGGPSDSFSLSSAAAYCNERGCKVVCAAGNAGTQTNSYPANTKGCIAVSATDESDNKAGFSQWGEFIDIAFPGVSIVTSYGSGYSGFSGTSASAPGVSGCIALIAEKLKSNGEVAWQRLVATCRNLGNALYFGAGIPDLPKALDVVPTEPPVEPPPPPPPEPPPPTGTVIDLTPNIAKLSCIPTAFEQQGEGVLNLINGNPDRKALWFAQTAVVEYEFARGVKVSHFTVWSANDYPDRDPVSVNIHAIGPEGDRILLDVAGLVWSGRYQAKQINIPVPADFVMTRAFVTFKSTGKLTPGGVIVQVGEARFFGELADVVTPPPPPPPVPNPAEANIVGIEMLWPSMTSEHKLQTKQRISSLP